MDADGIHMISLTLEATDTIVLYIVQKPFHCSFSWYNFRDS